MTLRTLVVIAAGVFVVTILGLALRPRRLVRSRPLGWLVDMAEGVVRFYSHKRGFGFITPDDRRGDVFVHQADISVGGRLTGCDQEGLAVR